MQQMNCGTQRPGQIHIVRPQKYIKWDLDPLKGWSLDLVLRNILGLFLLDLTSVIGLDQ